MTDNPAMATQREGEHPAWDSIAVSREFKDLVALKKTFILPAFVFFLVHFFALVVLVGCFPGLASTRVIGTVTLAYLFALSQFVIGWAIAGLYLFAATKFDALTRDLLTKIDKASESP